MANYTKPLSIGYTTYTNGGDDLTGANDTIVAGDVITWATGDHVGTHIFENYIGTKENPIYMLVSAQDIDLLNSGWHGIFLLNCSHIHFISTGEIKNVTSGDYGIFFRTGSFVFDGFTIDHLNTGNQGIAGHNDAFNGGDFLAHRDEYIEGYSSEYLEIRNCNISNSVQEHLYEGASNAHRYYQLSQDITTDLGASKFQGEIYQESLIKDILIENCNIVNGGRDGIQACAMNLIIRNSNIDNVGTGGNTLHESGIQVNPLGFAMVYNNKIKNAGKGIFCGNSGSMVFNNVIDGVKRGFAFNAAQTALGVGEQHLSHYFCHNTVINVNEEAIINFSGLNPNNIAYNNILHLVGAPSGDNQYYVEGAGLGINMALKDNLEIYGAPALLDTFVDSANGDYTLKAGSGAIDYGDNMAHLESKMMMNILGELRSTGRVNAGAY